MDLLGAPAGYERAAVQHLHQADHTRGVNLDAQILYLRCGDRQRQSLEQREVDMHVQALVLEGAKRSVTASSFVAHCRPMIEDLSSVRSRQGVRVDLIAQEGRELLVLLDEGITIVSAEDMMAVFDLFEDRVQLALHPFFVMRRPKISASLLAVRRHRPISQLRSKILRIGKCV